MVADSIGINLQCFPESALVLPEGANINKKKDVKVSFIIKGLHGNYC